MTYTRRIIHYSPGPTDFVSVLSNRAIAGCWFELHRQGGCGAAELRLKDTFAERNSVDVGDWIAFEFDTGDRWYFGRVEHRQASSPGGVTLRLVGMGIELNEVFPGGYSPTAGDGEPPHRYAATDQFSNDPDRDIETFDSVDKPHDLVELLLSQYVLPRTNITYDSGLIESSLPATSITSLKFHGEESVRAIVKELAVRARNASWGVNEDGTFFFLRQRSTVIATFQEGVDIVSLEESRERDLLFNRIVLTGGYTYDAGGSSGEIARRVYRWRGNYTQPASRDKHGERRIRVWVPWIRTADDSRAFTREFFRTYAEPPTRYLVEVANLQTIPRPWDGRVRLLARDGSELALLGVETIRVQFDDAPRLRIEVGPEDPRILWPEPLHDEGSLIPSNLSGFGGDSITLTESEPPSSSSSSSSSSSGSSGSSSSNTDACAECEVAPVTWKINALSGVTNDGCTSCDNVNREFLVPHSSSCLWCLDYDGPCGSSASVNIVIADPLDGGGIHVVFLKTIDCDDAQGAHANYHVASTNCLGTNTLTLQSNSGDCTNWPATITIEPA